MADGDIAAAAGYTVQPSSILANTLAGAIAKVQDDLATKVGSKSGTIPLSKLLGGTQAAAQSALGLVIATSLVGASGKIPSYGSGGTIAGNDPTSANHYATKQYVDSAAGGSYLPLSGGTVTGDIKVPNSTAAVSSYTIAYINGDGRISKGASSERFKKYIATVSPASIGDLFPDFKRWQMRGGDRVWRYGYTAEQLAADPVTEPFVIYERHVEEDGTAPHLERDAAGNPIPESIDFIGLLLAQNAQLNERLAKLEARDAERG